MPPRYAASFSSFLFPSHFFYFTSLPFVSLVALGLGHGPGLGLSLLHSFSTCYFSPLLVSFPFPFPCLFSPFSSPVSSLSAFLFPPAHLFKNCTTSFTTRICSLRPYVRAIRFVPLECTSSKRVHPSSPVLFARLHPSTLFTLFSSPLPFYLPVQIPFPVLDLLTHVRSCSLSGLASAVCMFCDCQ